MLQFKPLGASPRYETTTLGHHSLTWPRTLKGYLRAPSLLGKTFAELTATAAKSGWPGYLGAPRFASPALGALAFRRTTDALSGLISKILD